MKRILLFLLLLLSLSFTSCNLDTMREAVDINNTKEILITVSRGATTTSIGSTLMEVELIKSETFFKLAAKDLGADGKMKAGDYILSKSMSTDDIIRKLVDGDVYINTFTFTIPEGFEVRQIVDRLESNDLIDRESFIEELSVGDFDYKFVDMLDDRNYLEGYLFPDTYEMKVGASEHEIINKMLSRFNDIFKEEYYGRLEELKMSMNELITLSSIIEREAQAKDEFPLVASVFHNRIDIDMQLQSCATVQYVLGERKESLTYDDIAIDSPFNTYLISGLPPSPIASPGKLAIESALFPEETKYFYFVVKKDGNGTHVFSETLAQHNKAKEENR